jgi:hypothetical protein
MAYDSLLKDLEKKYAGKKKVIAPADAVADIHASFVRA